MLPRQQCRGSMKHPYENTLGFSIQRTAAQLRNVLGQRLRPFEITTEQFVLLSRLWQGDGISQQELGACMCKDRPTTARILARLEEKGLIDRRTDPANRRRYQVVLTAAGRALKGGVMRELEQLRAQAFKGLSSEDLNRVRQSLDLIFDNVTGVAERPNGQQE